MKRVVGAIAILLLAATAAPQTNPAPAEVGVDEHLGRRLPVDLVFHDEQNRPVRLGDLIQRPTFLTLVYYECPGICTPLLNGLVAVLDRPDYEPGRDYSVVTISFDETETSDLARRKHDNLLRTFHRAFPPDAWRFLTGDSASIAALTDAVGFRFQRQGRQFSHPAVLTILAPDGMITRYLYGITFLPFDVKMALTEASSGRVGPTVRRALLFCYSYDPQAQKYVFNFVKVAGTLFLVGVVIFGTWLGVSSRRQRRRAAA